MIYCTVKSKSLGYHNNPFAVQSEDEALFFMRSNIRAGKDGGLISNLDDLELVEIADFDNKSGKMKPCYKVLCADLTVFLKKGDKKE